MRRVVSLWLPSWPTDRLRRSRDGRSPEGHGAPPDEAPLVTQGHDGRRMAVAAANPAALRLGLRPGMALAQARSMVPGLRIVPADPEGDARALRDLAVWCLRYSPLTAADPPDGIWIDATGCAHLQGGEAALLADMLERLRRAGIAARAALADTPGAAAALARHGETPATIVPPGGQAEALAPLPVAALRLPAEMEQGLRRLGFERIGQLVAAPRPPLARRFGATLTRRLDQALGHAPEPITPVVPPEAVQEALAFPEPLLTAPALRTAIERLAAGVCAALARRCLGARRLALLFERVDNRAQVIRLGTARPSREPGHLARLLGERLDTVDPGFGIGAMRLIVTLAEPFAAEQGSVPLPDAAAPGPDLAPLVDRLVARFGEGRVFRIEPVESDVPERSAERTAPLARPVRRCWPPHLPRPVRLLTPPQPVEAVSALPDSPPAAFTWRRTRHRVRRADGPERIAGEWWRRDAEWRALRDYWVVEDEAGQRFWLYRRGDGSDPATGDLSWFLHGMF
ncbi:MAG: DNA polymerase Y family protein [Acetobacteraceae bacterium]|nr:DNA polymerase Y family protein [Acetobacteraceae bacterium]MDW8398796.1 DNA polymerase Y family protein [Acetobacteraceae bacterium]